MLFLRSDGVQYTHCVATVSGLFVQWFTITEEQTIVWLKLEENIFLRFQLAAYNYHPLAGSHREIQSVNL